MTDVREPGNGCLIIVAWVFAVGRLALAAVGLMLLIGYLLQACGRSVIHF
jgi:hypothetical protein